MEDYKEMDEWAEMKQQIQLLKEQLSNEQIVNERLIRASMRDKLSGLKKDHWIMAGMIVLAIPYLVWSMGFFFGLSWALTVVTVSFLLVAFLYDVKSHIGIRSEALLDKDLVEQSRKLLALKQRNYNWLRFGIPFLCVWICWFVSELSAHFSGASLHWAMAGFIVCLLVGAAMGVWKYKKGQRAIDKIVKQIDELTQK